MKLNTLKEMSQNKKIVLYGIAMVVFIIVIIKSFMSTYNAEKTKFLKREDIAKDKEIVVTDKSVLDLDQTVAIKNEFKEVKDEFKAYYKEHKKELVDYWSTKQPDNYGVYPVE